MGFNTDSRRSIKKHLNNHKTLKMKAIKGNAIGTIVVILAVIAAIIYFSGIGDGVVNPSVQVTYRESLVGNGYVFKITNASSKPLFNVTVTCDRWSKRYIISRQLNPGDSTEAGWLELPEGVKWGYTYYITADGYAGNYKVNI